MLVAIVALAIVDLAMLASVRLDRSSDDVVFVTLDERELRLVTPDESATAVALRFEVQEGGGRSRQATDFQPTWIDQQALVSLGFNCDVWPADPRAGSHYRAQLPRPAVVAFDIGTDVWAARLADWSARVRAHAAAEVERAGGGQPAATTEAAIEAGTTRASRLVPIEIAADRAALRGKYRARRSTLLLPVVVDLAFRDGSGEHERAEVVGWIRSLHPAVVPVPARLRSVFRGLSSSTPPGARALASALPHAPRYDVTLAIGPALRPWVVDARRLRQPDTR